MASLTFRVLGPIRARRDDHDLELGTGQQRAVLAMLLLRRGRTATVSELIDALWGEEPPLRATATLQVYVSRLRKVLEPERGPREKAALIVAEAPGYSLRVPPDALDLAVFERLVATAEEARRDDHLTAAAKALQSALDLWEGEPLSGIPGPWAETQRIHLLERLLSVQENRFDIELKLGRHAEVVADLATLAAEHPLRERLRELLMIALYRCGRQAEALKVYADTRRVLVEELGLDPGPELTNLHHRILTGDPELGRPSTTAIPPVTGPPSELPRNTADFIGRDRETAQLVHVLSEEDRAAMPVICITGLGGVGKTTLAVHVGRLARDHYPDGQLYVNLRGTDAYPAEPETVLANILQTLGVTDTAIPRNLSRRSALMRSLLTGRRILLILDDAGDNDQIRPLLPGSPSCAVIVTSRSRLLGINATTVIDLTGLKPSHAIELLGRIAGERITADPEAATQIAEACDFLPLAIRIVGSRLAMRPHWPIAALAEQLTDRHRRLDELRVGDMTVATAFELSYNQLDEKQARAFRLLALSEGDVHLPAAVDVLRLPESVTETILESLVDAGLLQSSEPGHYQYHDLVKIFARQQAARYDSNAERARVAQQLEHNNRNSRQRIQSHHQAEQ